MPKVRQNKWELEQYPNAFVYERDGKCYTYINGVRKVIKGLSYIPSNRERAMQILVERIGGFYGSSADDFTVYSAFEEFAKSYFQRIGKPTQTAYIIAMKKLLPDDMLLEDVRLIKANILNNMQNSNLSQNTQLMYLHRLNRFFKYCVVNEYITSNPIDRIIKPQMSSNEIEMYSREEVNLIIDYLNDKPVRFSPYKSSSNYEVNYKEIALIVEFISYSGTRINETLNIYKEYNSAPFINNSKQKSVIYDTHIVIDGKRTAFNKPKIRELPFALIPKLRDVTIRCIDFSPNNPRLFGDIKFVLYNQLKLVNKALGINENLSIHSLRKTAIHHWEKELNIRPDISAFMAGHSVAMKFKHYANVPTANELLKMHNF